MDVSNVEFQGDLSIEEDDEDQGHTETEDGDQSSDDSRSTHNIYLQSWNLKPGESRMANEYDERYKHSAPMMCNGGSVLNGLS